jgi:rare lipoprotein A
MRSQFNGIRILEALMIHYSATNEDPNSGMRQPHRLAKLALAMAAGVALFALPFAAAHDAAAQEAPVPQSVKAKPKLDRSGDTQVGKASIYSHKFTNKKMADGNKMDPLDDNAASKTLPLGTRAKVTNLETGQSTEVTIQDRGPYVKGRIVDLSPAKAEEIGLTLKDGVTKVEVAPIEVPMPDGSVKLGDGAESQEKLADADSAEE